MEAAAQKTAVSQFLRRGEGTKPGQYHVPWSVTHSPSSASVVHCTQKQQLPCSLHVSSLPTLNAATLTQRGCPAEDLATFLLV